MRIEAIVRDEVLYALRAVRDLYYHAEGVVGGYGHVVFDDHNFDCIQSCLTDIINDEYKDSFEDNDGIKELSRISLLAFEKLSEDEMELIMLIRKGVIQVCDL